ncbi:uncharacterized protein A1O5_13045 [Cladophialophora psammophila CBS 110553]|uniref:C2H2-type domain-containing protein n=1 Tax=Cladophialophora psammophila CBS 110553 TaxID=1182543 RepID=W9VKY3_9EURO|nr:uncharacterized protein A1O5_13045 [Cladophialophora psammophila CBS 110553]EXJ53690.1 hypothetical protein A1O5_13045 [Cladophialophora psammophila CBS 110553]
MANENVPPPQPVPTGIPVLRHDRRAPPRNDKGQIFCDHVDCGDRTKIFWRLCDWSRHIDTHQRPYKCYEPGCELILGFTYNGGLLRHYREVHKMHATTQPLFCPFEECPRSSGRGFTRKSNLDDHRRRIHKVGAPPPSRAAASHSQPRTRRRRRRESIAVANKLSGDEDIAESQLDRALRVEIRNKDDYIRKQAAEIEQKDEYILMQAAEIRRLRYLCALQ